MRPNSSRFHGSRHFIVTSEGGSDAEDRNKWRPVAEPDVGHHTAYRLLKPAMFESVPARQSRKSPRELRVALQLRIGSSLAKTHAARNYLPQFSAQAGDPLTSGAMPRIHRRAWRLPVSSGLPSVQPPYDAPLIEIVRRHLHLDSITDAQANPSLAHLPTDRGEHQVAVAELDAKQRAGQHGMHTSFDLYRFFFHNWSDYS